MLLLCQYLKWIFPYLNFTFSNISVMRQQLKEREERTWILRSTHIHTVSRWIILSCRFQGFIIPSIHRSYTNRYYFKHSTSGSIIFTLTWFLLYFQKCILYFNTKIYIFIRCHVCFHIYIGIKNILLYFVINHLLALKTSSRFRS